MHTLEHRESFVRNAADGGGRSTADACCAADVAIPAVLSARTEPRNFGLHRVKQLAVVRQLTDIIQLLPAPEAVFPCCTPCLGWVRPFSGANPGSQLVAVVTGVPGFGIADVRAFRIEGTE
jgi:hypothetical protein